MIRDSLPPWVTGDAAARRLWWMAGNPELVGIALTTYHLAVPLLACSAVVQLPGWILLHSSRPGLRS